MPCLIHQPPNGCQHGRDQQHQQDSLEGTSDSDAILLFTRGTILHAGIKGEWPSHRLLLVLQPWWYDSETIFLVGVMSSAFAVILMGGCLVFPSDNDGGKKGFWSESVLLADTVAPLTMQQSANLQVGHHSPS